MFGHHSAYVILEKLNVFSVNSRKSWVVLKTSGHDRLKCLNADSLEMRRIKFDLAMYYSILHELVHIPCQTLFQVRDMRTRTNGLTLYKEKFNCNIERYIFRHRQINIWNSLPQNVVSSSSLCLFKRRLNTLDLDSIIFKALVSAWRVLSLLVTNSYS